MGIWVCAYVCGWVCLPVGVRTRCACVCLSCAVMCMYVSARICVCVVAYVCVCVCLCVGGGCKCMNLSTILCVCVRERETERERLSEQVCHFSFEQRNRFFELWYELRTITGNSNPVFMIPYNLPKQHGKQMINTHL